MLYSGGAWRWTAAAFLAGVVVMASMAGSLGQAPPEVSARSVLVMDIQAAINQVRGGGTVRLPEGAAEAIGTIRLPGGVHLVGAGPGKTRFYRGASSKPDTKEPVILVDGSNGKASRISGIEINGFKDMKNASWDAGITILNMRDFRVDHCRITRFGLAGVNVRGGRGVVDHCEFVDNFKKPINNVGYGVVVMGTGEWRATVTPGGPDAVFIEDCEFRGQRHAVASNAGAHYVFRHNHVIGNDNSQAVDAHGPGFGSKRGTQWIEVYDNVIEKPIVNNAAMVLRGGGGVVFDNTIRDYKTGIQLTLDFDKSIDWTRSWPIPDQVREMWVWNNTLDGRAAQPVVPERSAKHIQLGRDYYVEMKPNYKPYAYPHPLVASEGR